MHVYKALMVTCHQRTVMLIGMQSVNCQDESKVHHNNRKMLFLSWNMNKFLWCITAHQTLWYPPCAALADLS